MSTQLSNLSKDELLKLVQQMQANAASKHKLIITEKGCVAVTGLRQFPVSFYPGEWEVILGMAEKIQTFIQTNAQTLAAKNKAN